MVYTVYLLTNKVNGKVYVGYTSVSTTRRFMWHFRDRNREKVRKRALARAMRKYGRDAFQIETLEAVESLEEAKSREVHYISLYRSNKCRFGYNMTPGGDGGMSEKQKEKIRKANTGRKHTDETRLKMRLAKLGKPGNRLGKKFPELSAAMKLKAGVGAKNRLWKHLPIAEIVDMYRSGMTTRAIGEIMRCDHTVIMDRLSAEGIPRRTRQEAARMRRKLVIRTELMEKAPE